MWEAWRVRGGKGYLMNVVLKQTNAGRHVKARVLSITVFVFPDLSPTCLHYFYPAGLVIILLDCNS